MGSQAIPKLQQNALPLQTIAQANAGTVVDFGQSQARFWDALTLGVNGVAPATVNTKVCLVTGYLDVRGLSHFAFTLRRQWTGGGAGPALTACTLGFQYRQGVADAPSASYVVGGGINDAMNAIVSVTSGSVIFPATTGAEFQTAPWAWDPSVGSGLATSQGTMIGYDVRLIVSWATNPVAATNLFTAWLWGSP